MTWRDLTGDRELELSKYRAPFWCPICDIPMKNGPGGDDQTYWKWGCCRYCFIEFIEHREERWEAGERPTAEAVARMIEKMRG